ncbi:MAG: nucleotidyltransferase [Deltaproteobacteria bacterium]|jgi:predicted nucleotidyltransferase|nr:MAG: nucleotidyltransferase [Deltaproteobacteria bacterium]
MIMKRLEEIEKTIRDHKEFLKQKYGVKEIGIFGSYVKGRQKEDSDLDILVDFEKNIGLIKFIELENYLSDILGIKVDLVMRDALKPRIGKQILKEVIYL